MYKPQTIDVEMLDFRFPASCVTISNRDSPFSSETEVNPGIRS
jgi:hypothetical protein